MVIHVYPEEVAIEMAAQPTVKMAVISITDRLERNVIFPANSNTVRIHRMKFDDEYFPKGNGPKAEYFEGLKEFVDDVYDKISVLIIHCAAGMSRSPAAAEAICRYLRDKTDVTYICPEYEHSPNPLIYKVACYELGAEN